MENLRKTVTHPHELRTQMDGEVMVDKPYVYIFYRYLYCAGQIIQNHYKFYHLAFLLKRRVLALLPAQTALSALGAGTFCQFPYPCQ